MKQFTYQITDENGIHARPAGQLVKEARQYASEARMKRGEKTADIKRLFALMGLGVKKGESVEVTVEGPDEEDAARALEAFLKENF